MIDNTTEYVRIFYEHSIHIPTRTLYLGYGQDPDYDLDQQVTRNMLMGMKILSSMDKYKPMSIMINNLGGEQQHGLAIYDSILQIRKDTSVNITVYGHCNSIAAWILQSGTRRSMSSNSQLMIHHGNSDRTKFVQRQDQKCVDILLGRIREKHPEYTVARLNKLLVRDSYMDATEALDLGLIDEVIE